MIFRVLFLYMVSEHPNPSRLFFSSSSTFSFSPPDPREKNPSLPLQGYRISPVPPPKLLHPPGTFPRPAGPLPVAAQAQQSLVQAQLLLRRP